jgi:hypothetical protein
VSRFNARQRSHDAQEHPDYYADDPVHFTPRRFGEVRAAVCEWMFHAGLSWVADLYAGWKDDFTEWADEREEARLAAKLEDY